MNTAIFKSYDIRGIYPEELDEDAAYAIGRAYVEEFGLTCVAVGRDLRASSDTLFAALARGITEAGAHVVDLGAVSTPMVYYTSRVLDVDGAVALTASHNPAEYNGFKLNLKNAVPVGAGSGMEEIRKRATGTLGPAADKPGTVSEHDISGAYITEVASFAKLDDSSFTCAVDFGNAMGALELPLYEHLSDNIALHTLYDDIDLSFPNHEANPMKHDTLRDLQKRVLDTRADIGVAYDGDADRAGFVDETGTIVRADTITSILAADILEQTPGATILYDLRSSKAVAENIQAAGGRPIECRVGHAHIKRQMAQEDASFAGELTGHFYFKTMSYAESASLAVVHILNVMARTDKKLSEIVAEVERYHHSGEINTTVDDPASLIASLKERYGDGETSELDGLKVIYPEWWFSVRASNTEPVVRLNLEATSHELMQEKRDELVALIQ